MKVLVRLHYDPRFAALLSADFLRWCLTGSEWSKIAGQTSSPAVPTGNMANTVTFPQLKLRKLRIVFTHNGKARSGVTELEAWEK